MQELLSIQEAADHLGVSSKTLRRWEASGFLVPMRTTGGQRRYTREQLKAFKKPRRQLLSPVTIVPTQPPDFVASTLSSSLLPSQRKVLGGVALTLLLSLTGAAAIKTGVYQRLMSIANNPTAVISEAVQFPQGQVLASEAVNPDYLLKINVPAEFIENITAPNVIYGITAGTGIAISEGQTPTISLTNPDPTADLNSFGGITVGSTTLTAEGLEDTLTIAAGDNISISTNTGTNTLTFSASSSPLGSSIDSSEITNDVILEEDLKISNSATDAYLLTYNSSTGGFTWTSPATQRGIETVQESDVTINSATASTIDFLGGDFDLTESPSGELNVQLASILTTPIGVAGNFDIAGTLTAGTGNAFNVTAAGEIQIPSTESLQIGSIELNDVGSSNVTSGAVLIGVYATELANSSSTNLQDVLDDLDSAIGAGSSKWSQGSGFVYLSQTTDDVVIGGSSAAAGSFHFDESAGTLFLGTNESLDGILTLYSSGSSITDPTFTTNSSGNLIIDSTNFDVTATGINSTAIGATTVSTGAFSSLSSTGATTLASGAGVNTAIGNTTGTFSLTGTTLGFTANGSGNDITFNLVDDNTDSFDLQQSTNNYININTTNSSEEITLGNSTTNPLFTFAGSGNVVITGADILGPSGENIDLGEASTDNITLSIAGSAELLISASALSPATDSGLDLGTSASQFADLFLDGGNITLDNATDIDLDNATATVLTISEGTNNYLAISTSDTEAVTIDLPVAGATSTTGNLFTSNIAKTINVGTGTAADIINIGNGGTTADTIRIGNGATANTITIGSASTTDLTLTDNHWSVAASGIATFVSNNLTSSSNQLVFDSDGAATGTLTWTPTTSNKTITLPDANGTVAVSASSPLSISAAGDISCSTCVTTSTTLFTLSDGTNTQAILSGNTLSVLAGSGITSTVASTDQVTIAATLGTDIDTSEIVNNTITATDLAATLTFADADYLDLSAILHDDSALQGLRLPNMGGSPTSPVSGEGFLAYDATNNVVRYYDGSSWVTISSGTGASKWTDGGTITYLTADTDDLAIGASNTLVAPFSVDVSQDLVRIGDASGTNGTLAFYASDADTGNLSFNTSDQFQFSGGDILIDQALTITGTEASTIFTLTAGDQTISDGSFSITDDDNAASLSLTNNTATTIGIGAATGLTDLASTSLTTGTLLNLELTEGTLAGGHYLKAWDATAGTAVFTIGEDGLTTITGSEGSNSLVITAGDQAISDGSLSLTDDDNAASFTLTNNTADTIGAAASGGISTLGSTSLTTGDLLELQLTEGTLTTGAYLRAWDMTGSASVFSIGEDGLTTIAGAGDGTDALVLTTGDILLSNGDFDLSGGDFNITLDVADGASFTSNAVSTADALTITSTGVGSDALQLTFTQSDDGDSTDTTAGLNIAGTSSSGDADNLYGINIGNITGGTATEYGLNIGTGWDRSISAAGNIAFTSLTSCDTIDTDSNGVLICGSDAGAGSGASKWTEIGGVLYPNTLTNDFAIGNTTAATAVFGVDESANTIFIGEGANGNGTLTFKASDADTGNLLYNTSDQFQFSGGAVLFDTDLIAGAATSLIDLSAVTHGTSAAQGLKLPQATSLTTMGTNEGFLAYDNDDNVIQFYDGSSWVTVAAGSGSSKWTDGGAITYLTATADDLVIGSDASDLVAPFSIDVSANAVRIGDGTVAGSATLSLFASDGDTGNLAYTTSDQFQLSGGDVIIDQDLTITGGDLLGPSGENIDLGDTTADTITLSIGGSAELLISASALSPATDSGLDLGTSASQFADLFLDGGNITLDNATDIDVDDNTANVFTITEGSNSYLDISTTNTTTSLTLDLPVAGSSTTVGNLFSSNVAKTVNIGTGTAADNINIGTGGTTADTLTLGNSAVATTLAFNSGVTTQTANTTTVNSLTSGTGLALAHTVAGATAAFTGDIAGISSTRSNTTGSQTLTDTGNVLDLSRSSTVNAGSAVLNVNGPLLNIVNTAVQTLGTLSDSAPLIRITQDADATGIPLHIISNRSSTGTSLLIEQSSGGTDALLLTDAGNLTLNGALSLAANSNQIVFDSDGSAPGTLTWAPTTSGKTITLPDANGTVAVSASGPLSLSASGDLSCATCVTTATTLFTLSDGTNTQTIVSGNTLSVLAGSGITTTVAATDQVTIAATLGTDIDSSEIVNNTITATDLAATLTFADGDYLDLSAILHDDTALQGFRLPNMGSSPSSPVSGEGFLAYDATNNVVRYFDGSSWVTISSGTGASKWTEDTSGSPGILYPSTITRDFAVGGITLNAAAFAVDESANLVYIGDGVAAGATTVTFKSDAGSDTGNLLYTTSDQFQFSGGDVVIDQDLTLTGGTITGPNSASIDIGQTTTGSLTFATGSTGDYLFSTDADSNLQIAASAAPGVDITTITNTGQGSTTNNVDALSASIFTATGTGANNSALHAIIGNAPVDASDVINGVEVTGVAQTTASSTQNLLFLDPASSGNSGGTLNAINIDSLTADSATEIAINIGTGWDTAISAGGTLISLSELQILDGNIDLSSEVTGTLGVTSGGTGLTSLTANGVVYGNGASAAQVTAAGTTGQLLVANGSGVPVFVTLSSDATLVAGGALTIAADAVALGTDTTGNYIATLTSGSGITISGSGAESAAASAQLGSLTSNWSQTGAFDIVLNNASSELVFLESSGGTYFATLDAGDLGGDKTYVLPDYTGSSADICLSTGNCTGSSSGVGGTGAAGQVTFFTAAQTVASENMFEWDSTNDVLSLGTAAAAADTSALLDLYGESEYLVLRPADVSSDGDTNNSAILRLRGTYDSDVAVGPVTSANFNFDLRNIMTAAGASPTSRLAFINNAGTEVLQLSSAGVLTLPDPGLLDLSNIVHNDAAAQGLKLPQASSLTAISGGGEGYVGWDTDDNQLQVFNGTSWSSVGTNYWQLNSNVIAPGGTATVTDRLALGGSTSTNFQLGVSGAVTGKALVALNETGDQNILVASASGTTVFTLDRTGDGTFLGGTINGVAGESIDLGGATADTLTFTAGASTELLLSTSNLTPGTAEGNSLGSATTEWEQLFLGDDAGVSLGLDQDWSLLYDETTDDRLELTTAGTSGLFISSGVTTNTTTGAATTAANSLTSGYGASFISTSTGLTSGVLSRVDWTPGSTTTATSADLFRIRIGPNGTLSSGNLFNVLDDTTSLFSVSETAITSALPHSFTAAGDIASAYDLVFTNQTASYIKSNAPLTLEAGESFENNNLTLKTFGTGKVVIDGGLSFDAQQSLAVNDTTPTVGGHSHFVTANSSGTTITAFDDGTVGQIIFIDHNDANTDYDCTASSLNCGSTDITTTAAGDASVWIYDGTVWNLVAFMDDSDNHEAGNGFDVAEMFPASETLDAGDVVSINTSQSATIKKSSGRYDTGVLGIVSTAPGIVLGQGEITSSTYPIALAGRVPVKISAQNGNISAGDYITSSDTPGVAMKATKPGRIIGKALEDWNPEMGTSTVLVFVDLSWIDPSNFLAFDDNGNLAISGQIEAQDFKIDSLLTTINEQIASMSAEIADIRLQILDASGSAALSNEYWAMATESGKLTSIYDVQTANLDVIGKLRVGLLEFDDLTSSISSLTGTVTVTGDLAIEGSIKVLGDSIGKAIILAGETEAVVTTSAVSSESRFFATPEIYAVPVATEATQAGQFVIRLPFAIPDDLTVNWWIVN